MSKRKESNLVLIIDQVMNDISAWLVNYKIVIGIN